jgi:hypothetical protein
MQVSSLIYFINGKDGGSIASLIVSHLKVNQSCGPPLLSLWRANRPPVLNIKLSISKAEMRAWQSQLGKLTENTMWQCSSEEEILSGAENDSQLVLAPSTMRSGLFGPL